MFVHLQTNISMLVAVGKTMDLLNLKTQANLMQI